MIPIETMRFLWNPLLENTIYAVVYFPDDFLFFFIMFNKYQFWPVVF